jgi:hypothetical protein
LPKDQFSAEAALETCGKLRSRGGEFQPLIDACQYALQLPRTLPNLVCSETVQRRFSPKQKPDIITAELTVEKMHSHYANVSVNGRSHARAHTSGDDLFAEQITSTGEFAGLFNVFNGLSETEFALPVDAAVGQRRVKRYDFRVKRENNIGWRWYFVGSAINPGYHGSVFVDGTSGELVRLIVRVTASEVDPETPVSESSTTLDYRDVVIGAAGARHVPVRGEHISCFRMLLGCVREELTFDDFHLFRADTRIIP